MPKHAILRSDEHRDLRVRTEAAAELGDGLMCCVTVPSEFRRVQNEFPIVFRLDLERDAFVAFALLGFETGENLFLEAGGWSARYRPLALDIQPFLIGRPAQAGGDKQVHLDLDSPRLSATLGERVFDEAGRPTPYLETIAEKLGALDEGQEGAAEFYKALGRHQLLEPLALDVTLDEGTSHRLVGFHVIDDDRLRGLDAQALGELHADGHLLPIFMALASLSNLSALAARKTRRTRHG